MPFSSSFSLPLFLLYTQPSLPFLLPSFFVRVPTLFRIRFPPPPQPAEEQGGRGRKKNGRTREKAKKRDYISVSPAAEQILGGRYVTRTRSRTRYPYAVSIFLFLILFFSRFGLFFTLFGLFLQFSLVQLCLCLLLVLLFVIDEFLLFCLSCIYFFLYLRYCLFDFPCWFMSFILFDLPFFSLRTFLVNSH